MSWELNEMKRAKASERAHALMSKLDGEKAIDEKNAINLVHILWNKFSFFFCFVCYIFEPWDNNNNDDVGGHSNGDNDND